jgi:hypothetical protein
MFNYFLFKISGNIMSIEVVDVPNEKMETSETKEENANENKDKSPEPEAKRPRGRAKGTKYPQTKYVYVDRDKDVLAKIDQLSSQLHELKVTSNGVGNTNRKQVERTPTPEPGAEPRSERNHVQQRMDRLQAKKQNYSNLFNSIHK